MGTVKRSVPRLLALTAMLPALGFAGFEEGVVLCFEGDARVAIEVVPAPYTEEQTPATPAAKRAANERDRRVGGEGNQRKPERYRHTRN